jgi:hypothetical protein
VEKRIRLWGKYHRINGTVYKLNDVVSNLVLFDGNWIE